MSTRRSCMAVPLLVSLACADDSRTPVGNTGDLDGSVAGATSGSGGDPTSGSAGRRGGDGGRTGGEGGGKSAAGGSAGTSGSAGAGGGTTSSSGGSAAGGASNPGTGANAGAGGKKPVGTGGAGGSGSIHTSPPGEWVNVTPSDISLDANNPPNNYAVQDVVVDPARPSDLYAFVCYQGVWRSQDFGQTWKKVSEKSSVLETGRPWSAGVDTNAARDPNTAPALYTFNGYGSVGGFFRSNDFGVHWQRFALPEATGQDGYSVNVDPYDGKHLLVGFHEAPGLVESTDGGETWKGIQVPAQSGSSIYAYFIDTGDAATTRKTWIVVAQANAQGNGTSRTEDGGATWTKVDGIEHGHGTSQTYQPKAGTIYLPGVYGHEGNGIYRSRDFGKTWHVVNTTANTTVIGTPSYLYSNTAQGWDPGYALQMRASVSDDATWKATTDPPTMTDGSKRLVTTFDGTHYIVVGGNWHAGIWRYVEP
jgi:hypothetical protein